jgi:hypothetical protein
MSSEAVPIPRGGLEQKWKVLISVMFGIFMIILDYFCPAGPANGAGVASHKHQSPVGIKPANKKLSAIPNEMALLVQVV